MTQNSLRMCCCALVISIFGCKNDCREGPRAATHASSLRLVNAITLFIDDTGRLPVDVPLKSDFNVNATNVYAQLSRTNEAGQLYLTASENVVLDSWSRPYLFRFDGDRDGQVTVGTHFVKERFAVWSAGPNGINELGAGDDVICWPSQE